MITIEIDDKKYNVAQSIDDITLGEWVALNNIIARREWKEIGKMAMSDEIMKELIPVDRESEAFKQEKYLDLLVALTGIEKRVFINFPSLEDEIAPHINWSNLFKDDSKVPKEVEIYEEKLTVLDPSTCEFQRWCDFENFVGDNMLIAFIVYLGSGKPYNRFHPDFETKMLMYSRVPAKGNVAIIQSIMERVHKIRDDYKFIYDPEDVGGSEAGRAMKEHSQRFKWEDVIVSIAETPMFTSDKGNLWAVRNANTLEVLDYLNLRRSKDTAEYKDMMAKDKNKKIL